MATARKFGVPEGTVVNALVGQWPVVRLSDDSFRALPDGLPGLGLMRAFVRSRAVIESLGAFGAFRESGPSFTVRADALDVHILHAEIGPIASVRKVGHDSDFVTHAFRLFDYPGGRDVAAQAKRRRLR